MSRLFGLVVTESALANVEKFPHKIRAQLIKKAKALILDPHPSGSKKLAGYTTDEGEPIYRQRSGDYRILYIVRSNPAEVVVLDIDNRKGVYRMLEKEKKVEDYRMKSDEFDDMMRKALGTPAPKKEAKKKRRSTKKAKSRK